MSDLKPIPISALPEVIKRAAIKSDKDVSGALNSVEEINQTAIRAKIDNPEKIKEYNEFTNLAKQYGYDLSKFPVEDYVAIYKEAENVVNDKGLPFIKKATVFLSKEDKDPNLFMRRENLKIYVKPRSVGIPKKGVFSSNVLETRSIIHLAYYQAMKKSGGLVSNMRASLLGAADKLYNVAGDGPRDVSFEDRLPGSTPKKRHYNVAETQEMIKLLGRAIESLINDPNEAPLIKDLRTTQTFLATLLK